MMEEFLHWYSRVYVGHGPVGRARLLFALIKYEVFVAKDIWILLTYKRKSQFETLADKVHRKFLNVRFNSPPIIKGISIYKTPGGAYLMFDSVTNRNALIAHKIIVSKIYDPVLSKPMFNILFK